MMVCHITLKSDKRNAFNVFHLQGFKHWTVKHVHSNAVVNPKQIFTSNASMEGVFSQCGCLGRTLKEITPPGASLTHCPSPPAGRAAGGGGGGRQTQPTSEEAQFQMGGSGQEAL